ncbi:MAG: PHD finger domain-containing protein [Candidatus Heimdallarchaeota archaeon]
MEPWLIFLIILGIAVAVIIIGSIRSKSRKKKPQQEIQSFVNFGDFVSAGAMHLKQKREKEAADLYFQTPPEKRPAYEAMVTQRLGKQGAQLFWIKTGRRFEKTNPENARIAFLLAGAYFDAVKMFVDRNDINRATEIINQMPTNMQEGTVRRLSQYSFNRGKYPIAADLLRAIGFVDEADAILAVGAHEFGTIERPEVAADMYDTVGRKDLVGESQEQLGEKALLEGKVEAAKAAFEKAVKAYDDSSQPKDALRVEDRLKRFSLLEAFREMAAEGRADEAEDMIDEISTHFPGIAVSDLYAEIASVLERNGKPLEAVTYYDKAADSTNNPLKRQGYVNALRRIGSQIAAQPSKGESVAKKDLKDNCIVCKRPIKAGSRIIGCPDCRKMAHYSHFVEWVKVQGSCPSCFANLKVADLTS